MASAPATPLSLNSSVIFVLTVTVHIPSSQHAEFFRSFNPVYDNVLREPDCLFFFVHKQLPNSPNYDPDVISWVEGWSKDADWLMSVQLAKEYYEPYRTETAKMYTKPIEYDFWTPVEEQYQVKLPAKA